MYCIQMASFGEFVGTLNSEKASLTIEVDKLISEKASLNFKLNHLKFGLQKFAGCDDDIRFYTGFPNYSILISCF